MLDDNMLAKREEFYEKIGQVAKAMGYSFKRKANFEPDTVAQISDSADIIINLRLGGYRQEGRIVIYGVYPDKLVYDHGLYPRRVEITVKEDADISRIITNIQKRLLPEYLSHVKEVKEHNAEVLAFQSEKNAIYHKFSQICPDWRVLSYNKSIGAYLFDAKGVFKDGELDYRNYDKKINLTLKYLTVEEAERILKALYPKAKEVCNNEADAETGQAELFG